MSLARDAASLFEMAKPRITTLLVLVAVVTYLALGGFRPDGPAWWGLASVVASVGLLSVGIFTLNHWMERDSDRSMVRTRDRPLAAGRFSAPFALGWGLGFTLLGIGVSYWTVNATMALVAFLTAVGYLVVYTPLKDKTLLHTALGALPGATPPLAGALAAQGSLSTEAWLLFAVLVAWQFPHFLSIEMLYRDDYRRADIQVVPVRDRTGFWTTVQIVAALIGLAALTAAIFPFGPLWWGAELLTVAFLAAGVAAVRTGGPRAARRLLRVSIVHLPLFFLLVLVHHSGVTEVWFG